MDVSHVCRSCMKDLAIWENNFNQTTLQMFTFCTNIIVLNSKDQLPQKFCSQCTASIESCCTFITTAREVDTKLKEIITTYKDIKPEISDSIDQYNFSELNIKTDSDNDAFKSNNDIVLETLKIEPKPESDDKKGRKTKYKILNKLKTIKNKRYQDRVSVRNNYERKSTSEILEVKSEICQQPKIKYKSELQCPFCDRVFLRKRISLKRHIEEHLQEAKRHEVTQLDADQTLDLYCTLCNKSYTRRKNFDRHMLAFHLNEESKETVKEKTICNMCDESFTSKSALLEHLEVAHLRYPCLQCSMTFITSPELYRHTKSEHKGRRFDCPHCPVTFSRRRLYTAHVKTHVGAVGLRVTQLRYICDYCKKSFRFKSELRLHLHIHDSTLKPALCDICGSRFSFRRALLDHRRVHTGEKPYTCEQCGYSCAISSNMARHVRAHRGERTHQCVQCGKAYNESTGLKKHMLWHTGERPYKCPHCERCYRNSSKRKIHMIRHHGLDPAEIPRLNKDGGPARRYITDDARARPKPDLTSLAQRTKRIHRDIAEEKGDLPNT